MGSIHKCILSMTYVIISCVKLQVLNYFFTFINKGEKFERFGLKNKIISVKPRQVWTQKIYRFPVSINVYVFHLENSKLLCENDTIVTCTIYR
jgi:hypothetical protein